MPRARLLGDPPNATVRGQLTATRVDLLVLDAAAMTLIFAEDVPSSRTHHTLQIGVDILLQRCRNRLDSSAAFDDSLRYEHNAGADSPLHPVDTDLESACDSELHPRPLPVVRHQRAV